jgi:hypothetical protein
MVRGVLLCTCSLVALTTPCLKADLHYEQTSRRSGGLLDGISKMANETFQKAISDTSSIIYIKNDQMRIDELVGNVLVRSRIYSMRRKALVWLYHEHKNHMQITFDEFKKRNPPPDPKPAGDSSVVKSRRGPKPISIIKDLERTEQINGSPSHLFRVSTKFQDLQTPSKVVGDLELVSDIWLCKEDLGFKEQEHFAERLLQALGNSEEAVSLLPPVGMMQDARTQIAMEEIYRLSKEMSGVPVQIISSLVGIHPGNGNASDSNSSSRSDRIYGITNEMRRIRRDPIDDSIFDIPKGYINISVQSK